MRSPGGWQGQKATLCKSPLCKTQWTFPNHCSRRCIATSTTVPTPTAAFHSEPLAARRSSRSNTAPIFPGLPARPRLPYQSCPLVVVSSHQRRPRSQRASVG